MTGTSYKALGFLVWRGGRWYLRRRYGFAKRLGTRALAAGVVAVAFARVLAQRRNGAR